MLERLTNGRWASEPRGAWRFAIRATRMIVAQAKKSHKANMDGTYAIPTAVLRDGHRLK